jgi:hypothetical protein
MRIASFDIGKKNFAFCVEEFKEGIEPTLIPPKHRYNPDGTCTGDFQEYLDLFCREGRIILLRVEDLTIGTDCKTQLNSKVLFNMILVLDRFRNVWDTCDVFVIEQQMSFGKRVNTMALKIGQHCYSYFLLQYGLFKSVVEFPAYHKTKVLGAPKKLTKPKRKSWAVDKALRILLDRDDKENIDVLKSHKKKDDLADVIVQLQAYKFLFYSIYK